MDKPQLVVFGFSGNAREAFDILAGQYKIAAFLDDRAELHGTEFGGVPILPVARMAAFPDAQVLCMIGSEKSFRHRGDIVARLGLPLSRFATVVHPTAQVSSMATIGRGVVIGSGACILANAVIGDHVMVMPNSIVHHDCQIGDHGMIGAGVIIAGGVRMGRCCYVGSGTTIKNDLQIADGSLIGLGSNVLRDVGLRQVVAGNPARLIRQD